MSGASPEGVTPPEVWSLDHPDHGLLELAVGGPDQLRVLDSGFPRRRSEDAAVKVATPGYSVFRGGALVARAPQVGDHKVAITRKPPARGEFTTSLSAMSGPRVQMRSRMFATGVGQVAFRDGGEIVHFDPPPGSAAEARLEKIAASPWKRVVYPLAAGVGRSGWAIAALVLVPILGRLLSPVIDWIVSLIPDVDIPWPDISLPSIPLPDIDLPSIDLPDVTLPGWVEFLLEYSKVWVPLVIAVVVAVLTVRHSRRSRRIRQSWADRRDTVDPPDDDTGETSP